MLKYKITLAGNPNVGKSTIFNILTGKKQHTGNWAGKTVENAQGTYVYKETIYEIYDLPGTYSLVTHSKEEEVARDFIQKQETDVTIVICNAVSLERSLNLVLQILEITPNVIVVVNLMDEANKKKISIDLEKLSSILKVPVIGCSALEKEGIEELKAQIHKQVRQKRTSAYKMENTGKNEFELATASIETSKKIASTVVRIKNHDYLKRERKIDKFLTNKITGIPIMLLLLFFIFWLTIIGSNYPSELLSKALFRLEELLYHLFSFLPTFWTNVLVHGMFKTLFWVVSVMLPPMMIFFPLFTILEDVGLLPRIAFNLDPIFSRCNSCGKQALTMCMGIGCNAVGVTGCRIIDSKKERIIAMITNSFMPCNGRYPTMIAVITMFFIHQKGLLSSLTCTFVLVLLILLSILMTFLINKILSKILYKEEKVSFILELSDYRRIKIGKLIIQSILNRTLFVLGRAIAVAAPAGILIYFIANLKVGESSILLILSKCLEPLGRIMGLDGIILLSFFLGFPANEIVMPIMLMTYLGTGTLTNYDSISALKTILIDNGWTLTTSICFLVFTLFHFPCSTTLLTIKKESNSWFITFLSFAIPFLIGTLLCIFINIIL